MAYTTLAQYLSAQVRDEGLDPLLSRLLLAVAGTCEHISDEVYRGALAGVLGLAG